MSQENVEIVRRHMEAFLSGDLEAALGVYSPDVELDATVRPEGRVYGGREGVLEGLRVWWETWENWKGVVEGISGEGERVLLVLHESGQGKGSGVEVEQKTFFVYTLRDGMIVHTVVLVDEAQALEAAGLSE